MSLRTSGLLKYSVCCKMICKLLFPVILAPKITNRHYVNIAMYECYVPSLSGTYINNVCFSSQKYVLRKPGQTLCSYFDKIYNSKLASLQILNSSVNYIINYCLVNISVFLNMENIGLNQLLNSITFEVVEQN